MRKHLAETPQVRHLNRHATKTSRPRMRPVREPSDLERCRERRRPEPASPTNHDDRASQPITVRLAELRTDVATRVPSTSTSCRQ
jgi:hypothetical protein